MRKERLINLKHSYKITQHPITLYWSTYVIAEDSKRKLIKKSTKEALYEALYQHYYPTPVVTTIAQLYPTWLTHKESITNRSTTIYRIDKYWIKYYVNDPVSKKIINKDIMLLSRIELLEWMCYLVKKFHMNRKAYTNMSIIPRSIFKYALDLNLLDRNEFDNVTIPRSLFQREIKKDSETQVFTQAEQRDLCNSAIAQYYEHYAHNIFLLSVPFVFLTGLRLGEVIGLTWKDVKGNYIYIHQSLMRDMERTEDGWLPASYNVQDSLKKNAKPRKIYLANEAQELLGIIKSHYRALGVTPTYVFEKDSKIATEGALGAIWKRLCKKIDILPRSPHKGRKTFVTTLIDYNLPLNHIREISGHENEQTTLRNYCYTRDEEGTLQDKMNAALNWRHRPIKESQSISM